MDFSSPERFQPDDGNKFEIPELPPAPKRFDPILILGFIITLSLAIVANVQGNTLGGCINSALSVYFFVRSVAHYRQTEILCMMHSRLSRMREFALRPRVRQEGESTIINVFLPDLNIIRNNS